jgi:hypothetical protein
MRDPNVNSQNSQIGVSICSGDKVYYGCNISPRHLHKCYTYNAQHFQNTARMDTSTGIPRESYHPRAHVLSGGFYITGAKRDYGGVAGFKKFLNFILRITRLFKTTNTSSRIAYSRIMEQ